MSEQSVPLITDNPLPNFYVGWKTPPWAVILHYTAGYTAMQSTEVLRKRKLSAHATVARDGTIVRHVHDANRAIHAGYGRWAGKSGMNGRAFGVEIVNFGWVDGIYADEPSRVYDHDVENPDDPELSPGEDVFYRREVYNGREYAILTRSECADQVDHRTKAHIVRGESEGVENLDNLLWATYPAWQVDSVLRLVWMWVSKNDILLENVLGHEHVTPHRKMDPGPAWPWQHMEKTLRSWAKAKPELLDWEHRLPDRVKAVQSHCDRMGFSLGSIDGAWGSMTTTAVEKALETYGSTYKLSRYGHLTADPTRCLDLCAAFRHVPGFDPGRT